MKKNLFIILSVACVSLGIFLGPQLSMATTDGGQAVVSGGITFYEESNDQPTTKEPTPSTGSSSGISKVLPNTGEKNSNYTVIGIFYLLLTFLLYKYRSREGNL